MTGVAALLVGVLAAAVLVVCARLREETHRSLVDRVVSVLEPLANRQMALVASSVGDALEEPRSAGSDDLLASAPEDLLSPVLQSAHFDGVAAVAVYNASGDLVRALPGSFVFAELPAQDFLALMSGSPVSRFHPALAMNRYFSGIATDSPTPPMLEVAIALRRPGVPAPVGFAQYLLDGRGLAAELAVVDRRIDRLAWTVVGVGGSLIIVVLGGAFRALRRSQRAIEERSERLARTNLELVLAAKSSALGQIVSHLIHGLQGPVAELRVATAGSRVEPAAERDWQAVTVSAEKLQRLVADAVGLLGESRPEVRYTVTGDELLAAIGSRVADDVRSRGVVWTVRGGGGWTVDNRCAGIVGLIAANLVQNAARATGTGRSVALELARGNGSLVLRVNDEGGGIPPHVLERLFTPGTTGRAEGTGLGLAISRLLARQLGGELELEHTSDRGTSFRLRVPVESEG